MTAYQWKIQGLFNVDANLAASVINGIYADNGRIEPAELVRRSRPENSPLHSCFEWSDEVAAEKYREGQARNIIQCIVEVDEGREDIPVRAYHHVESSYQPLSVVISSPEKTEELLGCALRELRTFESKYNSLRQLAPVFGAIQIVLEETTI